MTSGTPMEQCEPATAGPDAVDPEPHRVIVSGLALSCADVVAVARRSHPVTLHQEGRRRAGRAHALAQEVALRRPVYGQTTGVGANRVQAVDSDPADRSAHGLRLLRSHASGTGPLESAERVRAAMVIRLNQLAAGGSGVAPELLDALTDALTSGALPAIHRLGSIGTGDLCALAELGLTLCGELTWQSGGIAPVPLTGTDALALISSNAVTIGEAVLAHHDLSRLLAATEVVAGLSFLALGGAAEAYAAPVHSARAHPDQVRTAERMRALLGPDACARPGRRLQDPFCLRAIPQVHGTASEALAHLGSVLAVEINARAENPLFDLETGDAWHNANFHTSQLAHALDGARSALYPVAELSAARLGDLVDPEFTELTAFLAEGPPGSSGVMILEYVVQDSLASLRHLCMPAAMGRAVVSRGLEEHASFSTQAARLATAAVAPLRSVLAAELVAAVRAVSMGAAPDAGFPLRSAYDLARHRLDARTADRPLSLDLDVAGELLATFAGPDC